MLEEVEMCGMVRVEEVKKASGASALIDWDPRNFKSEEWRASHVY